MNKSTTKSLSLLLCLVLVLGLLPVGTLAAGSKMLQTVTTPDEATPDEATPDEATPATLYINGVDVRDIDAEDDTVSWDETTNTLTLNNASILNANGNYKGSGIYSVSSDTLVLELVGDSTVESKYNGNGVDDIFASAAISTVGDLVIRGEGSLTATDLANGEDIPRRSAGIYSGGELTIEGGNITAASQSEARYYIGSSGIISGDFDTVGTLSISGGTVIASGFDSGICSVGDMKISGGNVTATSTHDQYGYAINLFQVSDIALSIPLADISGGRVELLGTDSAINGLINCGSYDYCMWTAIKDGAPQYSSVPGFIVFSSDYLLIEPSNYRPAQPTAENRYTTDLEVLIEGEYTAALPEGITAEYQWYTQTSRDVTAQDMVVYEACTFDEATGLWSFTENSILAFDAVPGDSVTITLSEAPSGIFLAATYGESLFDRVADGVYSHTITEGDLDPETGLFIMLAFSEFPAEGTVSVAKLQEVTTAADEANRFSSETAGTYLCQVAVAENGSEVCTLSTKTFEYLPVNTVTFDAAGGSCQVANAKTQEGTHTLAQFPEATLTGYSLLGWFDAEGNEVTTDTVIMEDITVYAQWSINDYALTVQGMEGVIYQAPVTYGTELDTILSGLQIGEVITAEGTYTFNGSFDVTVPKTMPAKDLTLTAQYDFTPKPKGELVNENGGLYYYEDGKITYAGLIELDGNYYYIRTNGQAVTGRTYWITKTNGLMKADNYYFDKTGKLCKRNGLVEENGGLYYYVEGKLTYAGLIEIDGAYYYIRSNGQAVTDRAYWITKTNGLMDAASYTFGTDGKLVTSGSFVRETEGIFYYVDGKRTYAGLIEVDGKYYYVRSNGQLVTDRSYWITKTNELLPAANYTFDENGVMINAPL